MIKREKLNCLQDLIFSPIPYDGFHNNIYLVPFKPLPFELSRVMINGDIRILISHEDIVMHGNNHKVSERKLLLFSDMILVTKIVKKLDSVKLKVNKNLMMLDDVEVFEDENSMSIFIYIFIFFNNLSRQTSSDYRRKIRQMDHLLPGRRIGTKNITLEKCCRKSKGLIISNENVD